MPWRSPSTRVRRAWILGNTDGLHLDIHRSGVFHRSLGRTTAVGVLRYATHSEAPVAPNNCIATIADSDSAYRDVVLRISGQPREGGKRSTNPSHRESIASFDVTRVRLNPGGSIYRWAISSKLGQDLLEDIALTSSNWNQKPLATCPVLGLPVDMAADRRWVP